GSAEPFPLPLEFAASGEFAAASWFVRGADAEACEESVEATDSGGTGSSEPAASLASVLPRGTLRLAALSGNPGFCSGLADLRRGVKEMLRIANASSSSA